MKVEITTCDVCNPEGKLNLNGLGFAELDAAAAIRIGWLRKRDGSGMEKHICLTCQDNGRTELPK